MYGEKINFRGTAMAKTYAYENYLKSNENIDTELLINEKELSLRGASTIFLECRWWSKIEKESFKDKYEKIWDLKNQNKKIKYHREAYSTSKIIENWDKYEKDLAMSEILKSDIIFITSKLQERKIKSGTTYDQLLESISISIQNYEDEKFVELVTERYNYLNEKLHQLQNEIDNYEEIHIYL